MHLARREHVVVELEVVNGNVGGSKVSSVETEASGHVEVAARVLVHYTPLNARERSPGNSVDVHLRAGGRNGDESVETVNVGGQRRPLRARAHEGCSCAGRGGHEGWNVRDAVCESVRAQRRDLQGALEAYSRCGYRF